MTANEDHILFDLDQTIIPWDTQLVFRSYVLQQERWRRLFTFVFLLFLPLNPLLGAGVMKRIFHCYLFRISRARLDELASSFVDEWLPQLTYPEIVDEIRAHQAEGKTLVLSSASPELWVHRIGDALDFDLSLGTRFEWQETVPFFPDLIGENHKGEEKLARLTEHDIHSAQAGYTDSRADLPLLSICSEKTLVNPLSGVRKIGQENDWRILEPARPWKNRLEFGWGCTQQLFGFWKP